MAKYVQKRGAAPQALVNIGQQYAPVGGPNDNGGNFRWARSTYEHFRQMGGQRSLAARFIPQSPPGARPQTAYAPLPMNPAQRYHSSQQHYPQAYGQIGGAAPLPGQPPTQPMQRRFMPASPQLLEQIWRQQRQSHMAAPSGSGMQRYLGAGRAASAPGAARGGQHVYRPIYGA